MNIGRALLLAVLALSACKKAAGTAADAFPVKDTIAGVPMIEFDSPEAHFSCLAPRDWGIVPEKRLQGYKGAAFTLSDVSISILKYPESSPDVKDARKFAESFWQADVNGKQPDIAEENIGGATVLRLHIEREPLIPHSKTKRPPVRHDFVLVPVKGGFYEISHSAPAASYQKTLPVFEAIVRSFKPKS
ncbi:MAG: hypothetical protein HY923_06265 [Elusimicrobia bacterium]|nr:hypothetical protein [Elusimicrobiota bacterium]